MSFLGHRASGDATTLDRRVSQIRVIDPHHPLFGNCYPISDRGSGRGPELIVIRLPDGRERAISRLALASASDDPTLTLGGPTHISVRTLLPLANHVRAVLASRNADLEGNVVRNLEQRAVDQDRGGETAATAMAATFGRDKTSAGAAGGTSPATSAAGVRPARGGSSC